MDDTLQRAYRTNKINRVTLIGFAILCFLFMMAYAIIGINSWLEALIFLVWWRNTASFICTYIRYLQLEKELKKLLEERDFYRHLRDVLQEVQER